MIVKTEQTTDPLTLRQNKCQSIEGCATIVSVVDLLGKGTSCVVWSSSNPDQEHFQLSYVDLMSEGKPHLLTSIINNMGKEVSITYAPSTRFYLEDRNAGSGWITKLPFAVHVIESVQSRDVIGGSVHALHEDNIGPFEQLLAESLTLPMSRLMSWQRYVYWNAMQSGAQLGDVSEQ